MPDHDDQSQSTLNSATATMAEAFHFVEATINSWASACDKLVENAVEKDMPETSLADSLKKLGLKAIEAVNYINEFNQQVAIWCSKAKQPNSLPHELGAEGSDHAVDQQECDKAIEEAAWASLQSRLESAVPVSSPDPSSNVFDKMFKLLGQDSSSSTSLLKSVLAVAPHLADDEDWVFKDPYLGETQKWKMVYASQKPFENLVIKAQGWKVLKPVANSIWRLVILDKYIDFEKLYATLDPGYNPNNEAKELNEQFTLLEMESTGVW